MNTVSEEQQSERRELMVERQLAARGIRDPRVLEAFRKVPRHLFVSDHLANLAYDDAALPIGQGQTISEPYILALALQELELRGHETVLEVGTGSGYGAALLAELAEDVCTIERHADLAQSAEARLRSLRRDRIRVAIGDGTFGWPPGAPFEAVTVSAAGPWVPEQLRDQLTVGGRLIIPVGAPDNQRLLKIRCMADGDTTQDLGRVRFEPLVSEERWSGPAPDAGGAGDRPGLSPDS